MHHSVFAFYALPTRAWEFAIGGLTALLPRGALNLSRSAWLTLGWLGGAAVVGSSIVVTPSMPFPGWTALIPVLGTAITLAAGAEQPHRGVGALFDAEPLQKLGSLSYSWYLWHWPFLVLTAAFFPAVSPLERAVAGALSLGVAYVTHRFFENPIRFNSYLMRRPGLSLSLGGAAAAVCLAAATLSLHFANHLAETPKMKALYVAYEDPIPRRQCIAPDDSSEVKTCTFGTSASGRNIVLFGDSHAIQWFDALAMLTESHRWKLTTFVKFGCAAIAVSYGRGVDADPDCVQWRADAVRRIIALRPSLVLIGSATNRLGRADDPTIRAGSAYVTELREQTELMLLELSRAGLRVGLIRDTPEFPFDVRTCLARSVRHSWYPGDACEMPRAAVMDPAIYDAENSAARGMSNVRFIDMTDQLCPDGVCRAMQNGLPMYRDTHHLSGRLTVSLVPQLEAQVMAALLR